MDEIRRKTMEHYYFRPYHFVCDIILKTHKTGRKPSNQQTEVLMHIQDGLLGKHKEIFKHIGIKSGHGVGKSALISWFLIWFMNTRPHCRIPCTAPTQAQLFDILWTEVSKWMKEITHPIYKDRLDWTATHITNHNNQNTWFAVARSSNKPENMQGFHADELLFMLDEASGVPQDIMEVVQGALTNEGAWCIMTGNPTQLSGTFFDAFHKERKYWKVFTFSCVDSNIVTPEYVERMKGKYGENSSVYHVRVLGEFPEEAEDTIIPLPWAEVAAKSEIEELEGDVYIGVDVARFGSDKTIIIIRQGNEVKSMKSYAKQSTMETVGYIMLAAKEYEKFTRHIRIDDTGVGGGVTDRLNELLGTDSDVTVEGVNNGSKADKSAQYFNKGSELWFNMRERIRSWNIPDDEELIAQLSTRKFKMASSGKLQVERKEDMKDRGLVSPDKADALSLAFMDSAEGGVIIDF